MKYLTIPEVAEMFQVSYATAMRWFHRGLFPNAIQVVKGGMVRIPTQDIEKMKKGA